MLNAALEFIFPQTKCSICRRSGNYAPHRPWCAHCGHELAELAARGPVCDICGRYIAAPGLCADCHRERPEFGLARAVGPYEQAYRIAVKVYKFMGRRKLAWPMGKMMAEVILAEPGFWPIDVLVAVPISKNSMDQRGFNQTDLLARQISRHLKIPFVRDAITRVREVSPQRELSREEREQNLKNAFEIRNAAQVAGKRIVLVDDVYTTGSTARECTRDLLDAGAERVSIITWATGRAD
ncbi:MAG: ComF family protein [Syntrophomonadaceae bacterium]|nr:ComF family protein [Syntrophomonadaceae bacterium]